MCLCSARNTAPYPPQCENGWWRWARPTLPKVILHDSGPYIVSAATFPSYFLKQDQQASQVHAQLDLAVFERIARQLNIGARYVGEEPFSQVTALYNRTMAEMLPGSGVEFHEVPACGWMAASSAPAAFGRRCMTAIWPPPAPCCATACGSI